MNVATRKRRIVVVMTRLRGVLAEKTGDVLLLLRWLIMVSLHECTRDAPFVVIS